MVNMTRDPHHAPAAELAAATQQLLDRINDGTVHAKRTTRARLEGANWAFQHAAAA